MNSDINTCIKIVSHLTELFNENNIDEGHGIEHALKVMDHADNALILSKEPRENSSRQAIRYAALLHDADDRKFFPTSQGGYQNARRILNKTIPKERSVIELVLKMIDLVSCSSNGNSLDKIKKGEEWMLIPRMCDRLEAIGEIGVLRVWIYNKHVNRPLFLSTTPRASNMSELKAIATPDRFNEYLQVKKSASMIDHFYDKLLHIGTDEVVRVVNNPYIRSEAQKRHDFTVDFVLKFGETGDVDIRLLNKIRYKNKS